jgi:hypothetical protein
MEEIDETEEAKQEVDNSPIEELKRQLKELDNKIEISKFARVETKPEFASEIVNTQNNQKISNLNDDEIGELLEKRKFYNLLKNFGWNRLAKRILNNIQDVENYSLSYEGFLIDSVLTDKSKQANYNYNTQKMKGGFSK